MKNLLSNKVVRVLLTMVLFVVVWAIIDWITALASQKTFVFDMRENLVSPAILGAISALVQIWLEKKNK